MIKNTSKKKSNNSLVEIDPSLIYFQHSKIKPVFSDNRKVDNTIKEIKENLSIIENIPVIHVYIDNEGNYFSLNNRRLYVYKILKEEGFIDYIKVRLEQLPKHLVDRYNTKNCSLSCKFMYIIKDKNCSNKGLDS